MAEKVSDKSTSISTSKPPIWTPVPEWQPEVTGFERFAAGYLTIKGWKAEFLEAIFGRYKEADALRNQAESTMTRGEAIKRTAAVAGTVAVALLGFLLI